MYIIDSRWFCKDGRIRSDAPLNIRHQNFLNKCMEKHGDRYEYSTTKYTKSNQKVEIICREHGPFQQLAADHLKGANCPTCGQKARRAAVTSTLDEFIRKAVELHGDQYDYTKIVEYINNKTEIPIQCNIHGIFYQTPDVHLRGCGCPRCGDKAKNADRTDTTEIFVQKAINIHGTKYQYNKVEYVNAHTNVIIICPNHGEFKQTPVAHIHGQADCPICARDSYILDCSNRGIYLLYSKELSVYKIGITNNIKKRLIRLNKFDLVYFYDIKSNEHSMKLEFTLHDHFKSIGKWCDKFLNTDLDGKTELFNLNADDLAFIDTYIKEYCTENNLIIG